MNLKVMFLQLGSWYQLPPSAEVRCAWPLSSVGLCISAFRPGCKATLSEGNSFRKRPPLSAASKRYPALVGLKRASEEGDGGSTDQSSPPCLSRVFFSWRILIPRTGGRRAARELIQICSGHELVFRIRVPLPPSPPAPFASLPVFARNGSIDPGPRVPTTSLPPAER